MQNQPLQLTASRKPIKINNDQSVEVAELDSSDMAAAARPSHPGLAEALEILQSLSPRPKISKPRTRKWKMESTAVIT